MNKLKLIIKALWKRKIVNVLIIIQITISLMILFELIQGMYNINYLERKIKQHVKVNNTYHLMFDVKLDKGQQVKDFYKFENEIKNIKGISGVGAYDYTNTVYNEFEENEEYINLRKEMTKGTFKEKWPEASEIIKLDYDLYKLMKVKLIEGVSLSEEDFKSNDSITPILIGEKYKKVIPIGMILTDEESEKKYIVKGIIEKGNEWLNEGNFINRDFVNLDQQFIVPLCNNEKIERDTATGRLQSVFYIISDSKQGDIIRKQVEEKFSSILGEKIIVKSIQEKIDENKNKEKTSTDFLIGLAIFLITSSCLGMINVMLSSIKTRKREIGIRIMAGASKKYIRNLILGEIITINLIGVTIAVIFRVKNLKTFNSIGFTVSLGFNIMIILTMITAIVPLRAINKLQPKELIGGIE